MYISISQSVNQSINQTSSRSSTRVYDDDPFPLHIPIPMPMPASLLPIMPADTGSLPGETAAASLLLRFHLHNDNRGIRSSAACKERVHILRIVSLTPPPPAIAAAAAVPPPPPPPPRLLPPLTVMTFSPPPPPRIPRIPEEEEEEPGPELDPHTLVHNHHAPAPKTPASMNPMAVRTIQCLPIQKMRWASLPCQLEPPCHLKKDQGWRLYSSGMRTRTTALWGNGWSLVLVLSQLLMKGEG